MADWKSALSALEGMGSGNLDEVEEIVENAENSEFGHKETISKRSQKLRLYIERSGRGGKTVTVIKGFVGSFEELEALCKTLKQKMGIGGSAKEGEIILQGDQRKKLLEILISQGYTNTK